MVNRIEVEIAIAFFAIIVSQLIAIIDYLVKTGDGFWLIFALMAEAAFLCRMDQKFESEMNNTQGEEPYHYRTLSGKIKNFYGINK